MGSAAKIRNREYSREAAVQGEGFKDRKNNNGGLLKIDRCYRNT